MGIHQSVDDIPDTRPAGAAVAGAAVTDTRDRQSYFFPEHDHHQPPDSVSLAEAHES